MNIIIAGATGFVGRALALRLKRDGHHITALLRRAQHPLGDLVTPVQWSDKAAVNQAVAEAEVIINLAGEPIVGKRWNPSQKERLRTSRIDTTNRLVAAMGQQGKTLINASAVGIYGDRGDEILTESSTLGSDFVATLCNDWETAAHQATGHRVVTLRISIVLGLEGALSRMVPPIRAGVGGRLGNGRQWTPWIHIDDLVELIVTAINNDAYQGPINAAAPHPVTNQELTEAIGAQLGKRTPFAVPKTALRLALGEAAQVVLQSTRVQSERLEDLGFAFRFSHVSDALRDLFGDGGVDMRSTDSVVDGKQADHVLEQVTTLPRPLAEVFPFFSRPENLGLITPSFLGFKIRNAPAKITEGATIDYTVTVDGLPLNWVTDIRVWEDGKRFVDNQRKGPYRLWWHEHLFEEQDGNTVMTDRVHYTLPMGPMGRLVHHLRVQTQLQTIFRFRKQAIAWRFGHAA